MNQILDFFKTKTGKLVAIALVVALLFWLNLIQVSITINLGNEQFGI